MADSLFLSALLVLAWMTAIFVLALVRKDNSIVDIAWGLGFILLALLNLGLRPPWPRRRVLVTVLVLVWALRLAIHIFRRNRKRGEDFRYAIWRRRWGRSFILRSYLQIFLLQGVFMLLVAAPILIVDGRPSAPWTPVDAAGVVLWIAGFVIESAADAQLSCFKKIAENRGRIITSGLWRLSRHPNYFGEAAMWWGLAIIVLSVPGGWPAVLGPLTITFLLRFVSGVPLLEKKYAGNSEFAAYARRTNAFVPWFPKR